MATQSFQAIHLSYLKGKNDYDINPAFCALLLIVVFLLSFLLLCHIYMCTHRDEIRNLLPANQNGALARRRTATMGLDAATIGGLPTFFYESSESKDNNKGNQEAECCICLGIFEEGDKLKVLPRCHHGFHSECVDIWLGARSSCPLCRASVLQDPNGNSMAAQV